MNYAFSFLAVPCLYYVICLLPARLPNATSNQRLTWRCFLLHVSVWHDNEAIKYFSLLMKSTNSVTVQDFLRQVQTKILCFILEGMLGLYTNFLVFRWGTHLYDLDRDRITDLDKFLKKLHSIVLSWCNLTIHI